MITIWLSVYVLPMLWVLFIGIFLFMPMSFGHMYMLICVYELRLYVFAYVLLRVMFMWLFVYVLPMLKYVRLYVLTKCIVYAKIIVTKIHMIAYMIKWFPKMGTQLPLSYVHM